MALAQQLRHYHALLRQHLPESSRISIAEGGLVIWIQIPGIDSQNLLNQAKRINIYCRPGQEFSRLGLYKDCFRLNFGWSIGVASAASLSDGSGTSAERVRTAQLVQLCALIRDQLVEITLDESKSKD